MYKTSIATSTAQVGECNPVTLQYISNLALLYHKKGKFKEAKPLFKKCVQIGTKLHGADNSAVQFWRNRYNDCTDDDCVIN